MRALRIKLRPETLQIVDDRGHSVDVALATTTAQAWVERYTELGRSQVPRDRDLDALVELGTELYEALLGTHEATIAVLEGGCSVEFVIDLTEGQRLDPARQRAFFDAPWELLCGPSGWLAASGNAFARRILTPTDGVVPEPSRHRLLVVYMAGAPYDLQPRLDFEGEEARILAATDRGRLDHALDLLVQDSGVLEELHRRLHAEDDAWGQVAPDVLHLSSHGGLGDSGPFLMLEDHTGQSQTVGTQQLVSALGDRVPQALFLSASETASWTSLFPALAESLVRAGVPAALGWASQVSDEGATAAASELYAAVSEGAALEFAVARARAVLLPRPEHDWHRLRLVLGPKGGGPLVRGPDLPSRLRRRARALSFASLPEQWRLGLSATSFVGRRRTIMQVLQILSRAPVLVHGLAGVGKSSLALRIAQRLQDHAMVVISDCAAGLSAESILTTFVNASDDDPSVVELRDAVRRRERDLESTLEVLLTSIYGRDGRLGPVLMVLDNLDALIDINGDVRANAKVSSLADLTTLVRAFRTHAGGAKLLATSRYALDLGIDRVHLGGLTPAEARNLAHTISLRHGGSRLIPAVVRRSIEAARGHPSLLLGIVDAALRNPVEWERRVCALESLAQGTRDPSVAEVGEFIAAIEATLETLTPSEQRALQQLAVFQIGITPASTISPEIERLRGLGLLEASRDLLTGFEDGVILHPFVRPFVAIPDREVQAAVFREWVDRRSHWSAGARPLAVYKELLRLARVIDDAEVIAHCGAPVLADLHRRGRFGEGARVAVELRSILARHDHEPPPEFIWRAAELLWRAGDLAGVEELLGRARSSASSAHVEAEQMWLEGRIALANNELDRAEHVLREASELETDKSVRSAIMLDLAAVMSIRGHPHSAAEFGGRARDTLGHIDDQRSRALAVLAQLDHDAVRIRGEPALVERLRDLFTAAGDALPRAQLQYLVGTSRPPVEALPLFREALMVFESLGDARSGELARLELARALGCTGKLDEAEHQLRACEAAFTRLGEARARVMTLVEFARLRILKGELDDARRFLDEVVGVCADDRRVQATALGQLARIAVARGEYDRAFELHAERKEVFARYGDQWSEAISVYDAGQLLARRGELDRAQSLFESAADVFDRCLNARSAALCRVELARIAARRGEFEEARDRFDELLPAFDALGDLRSGAVIRGELARLNLARGDLDQALERHSEELRAYQRLGDQHAEAITLVNLGEVHLARGDKQTARSMYRQGLAFFERTGAEEFSALVRRELSELD